MVNRNNQGGENASSSKGEEAKSNSGNQKGGVDRRTFLRFAGVGSGAAMVAGCVSTEGTPSPTEGHDDDHDDDHTGTESFSVDGPVQIGVLGPSENPIGASILRAAELAAAEINEAGGIAGADVEILTKDTMEDPATTRTGYQELTTGQDVDFTVGIFGSEELLAIMDDIASQETLHLSSGAASPEASRLVSQNYEKYKYYFRAGPTNSRFLGRTMMEFARARFDAMGWDSIALLIEDFKWTGPVQDYLDQNIGDLGVDVPVQKVVPEGTEDFTPVFDDMEAADVDGCYTVLAHMGTPPLVQWVQQQRPFGFGGIHVAAQLPAYYAATNGAARYVFTNSTATPTSEVTPQTIPFVQAFNEMFDKYPVYTGYITYDAMLLLKRAVEQAQSMDPNDLIPVLEETNQGGMEFTGAAGIPSFYPKDHRFAHDLRYNENTRGVFFQWQDVDGEGSQQVVWPDSLAESEYQSPPWA